MMQPERMEHRPGKGLVIIHNCTRCGLARANRLARDTIQEDDISTISALMSKSGSHASSGGFRGQFGRHERAVGLDGEVDVP
jgi:RNHCP domain